MIDRAALPDLLGAHVRGRAEEHARAGVGGGAFAHEHLGDAEIEDLDDLLVVLAGEEDVLRLQVAVDDARLVGAPEGARDLREDPRRRRDRQPALALEAHAHRLARQELHRDVRDAAVEAVVVDSHDVRNLEHGGGAGLAFEAGAEVGHRGEGAVHEFDGHGRAELDVLRAPDGAHPAARELPLEHVFAREDSAFLHPSRRGLERSPPTPTLSQDPRRQPSSAADAGPFSPKNGGCSVRCKARRVDCATHGSSARVVVRSRPGAFGTARGMRHDRGRRSAARRGRGRSGRRPGRRVRAGRRSACSGTASPRRSGSALLVGVVRRQLAHAERALRRGARRARDRRA